MIEEAVELARQMALDYTSSKGWFACFRVQKEAWPGPTVCVDMFDHETKHFFVATWVIESGKYATASLLDAYKKSEQHVHNGIVQAIDIAREVHDSHMKDCKCNEQNRS